MAMKISEDGKVKSDSTDNNVLFRSDQDMEEALLKVLGNKELLSVPTLFWQGAVAKQIVLSGSNSLLVQLSKYGDFVVQRQH